MLVFGQAMAQQTYLAPVGRQKSREDADQRRFTGTVRSQKAVCLAVPDFERDSIEGPFLGDPGLEQTAALAKALAQPAHLNGWMCHGKTSGAFFPSECTL